MSSFSVLRDKRRARQGPSFASSPVAAASSSVLPSASDASSAQASQASEPLPSAASVSEVTSVYSYESGGLYKALPAFLEIRVSERRGRGIYVRQGERVKAGTTLLRVVPHAYALSASNLPEHCTSCLLNAASSLSPQYSIAQLKRCTACLAVFYCSKECQTHDWPEHKEECRRLKRLKTTEHGKVPGEAVRVLGRIVSERKRKGGDNTWWKEVELMQSNIERLPPAQHEPLSMLGLALCQYLDISPQESPPEETARKLAEFGFTAVRDLSNLLSRFQTNSFSLTSPNLTNVGVAICPLAALISHSCAPNAVVVFPTGLGRRGMLEVVALQDLEPGVEVLTPYVDITLSEDLRQKQLKERYLFECVCGLCSRDEHSDWVDPREAIRCRGDGCQAKLRIPATGNQRVTCKVCETTFKVNVSGIRHSMKLGVEVLEKAESLQSTDPAKSQHLAISVLPQLSAAAFSSYPLLSLLQLLQELLITQLSGLEPSGPQGDVLLQDSAMCAALVLKGMEDVYPLGYPSRGVQYVTMAKLLMAELSDAPSPSEPSILPETLRVPLPTNLARLKMAMELLSKASQELERGFGRGGGLVGKDVRILAEGLEREIRMWSAMSRAR